MPLNPFSNKVRDRVSLTGQENDVTSPLWLQVALEEPMTERVSIHEASGRLEVDKPNRFDV